MYGLTRATVTLISAAIAGLLIWLATQIGSGSNGEYWATYGLVAAAGLVMALSQLLGGWTKWGWPRISISVLLWAFIPVAIVVLWMGSAAATSANGRTTSASTVSSRTSRITSPYSPSASGLCSAIASTRRGRSSIAAAARRPHDRPWPSEQSLRPRATRLRPRATHPRNRRLTPVRDEAAAGSGRYSFA